MEYSSSPSLLVAPAKQAPAKLVKPVFTPTAYSVYWGNSSVATKWMVASEPARETVMSVSPRATASRNCW